MKKPKDYNDNLLKCAFLLREYYENDYLFIELSHKERIKIDKRTRLVLKKIGLYS